MIENNIENILREKKKPSRNNLFEGDKATMRKLLVIQFLAKFNNESIGLVWVSIGPNQIFLIY